MSLPESKRLSVGTVTGTVYDFADAGDELPLHVHDKATNHITIVARGSVEEFGADYRKTLSAGAIVAFKAGVPHGFRALEAGSRIVQINHERDA